MYRWLVTLRAAGRCSDMLGRQLKSCVLPLLRRQDDCVEPELAACIHCVGEHTYLARWPSEKAVVEFEHGSDYQAALETLAPLLLVPPKRELWAILT